MKHPFDYHRPNEAQVQQIEEVRTAMRVDF